MFYYVIIYILCIYPVSLIYCTTLEVPKLLLMLDTLLYLKYFTLKTVWLNQFLKKKKLFINKMQDSNLYICSRLYNAHVVLTY